MGRSRVESDYWKDMIRAEAPRHPVAITKPFCLGTYPVTVGQYRIFVTEKGYQTDAEKGGGIELGTRDGWKKDPKSSWTNPGFEQTDDHPVVGITWRDAKAFCDWLSAKEGKQYVLPSEAQWEYACRAGTETPFSFGDDSGLLADHAWYNASSDFRSHPVGTKKPNAWGLHDMHGNVRNLTADWYAKEYYAKSPLEDPTGPPIGTDRVARGGEWYGGVNTCRSSVRCPINTSRRFGGVGFRVALVGDLKAKEPPAKAP